MESTDEIKQAPRANCFAQGQVAGSKAESEPLGVGGAHSPAPPATVIWRAWGRV